MEFDLTGKALWNFRKDSEICKQT